MDGTNTNVFFVNIPVINYKPTDQIRSLTRLKVKVKKKKYAN